MSQQRSSKMRLAGLVARREYVRTVRRRGYVFGDNYSHISTVSLRT